MGVPWLGIMRIMFKVDEVILKMVGEWEGGGLTTRHVVKRMQPIALSKSAEIADVIAVVSYTSRYELLIII